ncbi:MAG TPA: MaoC family dehydratase [Halanaerobiales bacterium]|nr:MaoC family dehydratase [Halanaerobiales bacterium]
MDRGKTVNELEIGEKASFTKTITETDVYNYAGITGDFNPAHVNESFAKETMFKGRIAHGMIAAGLISTVLGTQLPGPGSVYVAQDLKFTAPVRFGDTVTATAEVEDINEEKNRVTLNTVCTNQKEEVVLTGQAELMPTVKGE